MSIKNGGEETIGAARKVYDTARKIVEVIEKSEIAESQALVSAVIKVVAVTYSMKAE